MAGDPLLLAIESATERVGVALLRGEAVLAVRTAAPGPASEGLLPAVDAALGDAGLAIADVAAFAVSTGPGSFTGLRVGIATVKGLAFGAGAPRVAAVPTLAALASCAPGDGPVAALLDARRGEVYAAVYAAPDRVLEPPLAGPGVYRAEALAALLPAEGATLVGEGVALVREAVAARLGDRAAWLLPPAGAPDPAAVGRLGARLLARGAGVPAEDLVPFYARRAEAEARRTGRPLEAPPPTFDTRPKFP